MVELNREPSFSKLVVDENDISDSSQRVTALDINLPFYVGGILPENYNQVQANLVSNVQRLTTFLSHIFCKYRSVFLGNCSLKNNNKRTLVGRKLNAFQNCVPLDPLPT